MIRTPRHSFARGLRIGAAAALLAAAAACAGRSGDGAAGGAALRDALPVAAAALASGQPDAARRLYRSLADRFDDAPEPLVGLGTIAFHDDDFAASERYFVRAAALGGDAPELRAAALLGAGRAALARGAPGSARGHFRAASDGGASASTAAWAANGLAVAAALDADYETAAARWRDAMRLSPGHPRIAANFVRMLAAAGRPDEAAGVYAAVAASDWTDGDGAALARLVEEARARRAPAGRGGGLALSLSAFLPAAALPLPAGANPAGLALRASDLPLVEAGAPPPSGLPLPSGPPPPAAPSLRDAAPPDEGALNVPLGQSRRIPLDREATAVLVASPDIADVQLLSPNVLYVIGRGVGRTTVVVVEDDERAHERVVSVVLDIEPLRAALAEDPDLSGIRARRVHRGVALAGEAASPEIADRALRVAAAVLPDGVRLENELRIAAPQQVNLEVQIAEVQRSVTEDLGINWEAFGTIKDRPFRFRVGRILHSRIIPDIPDFTIVDGTPAASFEFHDETSGISAVIDALATAGLANVLARPNVTAVTGETASFFSGGEYPLPTGFEDGVIIFEYKKYGVLLDFVPTVLDSGRIVLTVRPEVSEPSLNQAVRIVGVDVPVINVRRAETTVEVGDGESIVIAGLFRNASNTVESGLPLLKDMPGAGALFGHTSTRASELELIVVVTARLTGPSAPAADAGGGPLASRRTEGYHY